MSGDHEEEERQKQPSRERTIKTAAGGDGKVKEGDGGGAVSVSRNRGDRSTFVWRQRGRRGRENERDSQARTQAGRRGNEDSPGKINLGKEEGYPRIRTSSLLLRSVNCAQAGTTSDIHDSQDPAQDLHSVGAQYMSASQRTLPLPFSSISKVSESI